LAKSKIGLGVSRLKKKIMKWSITDNKEWSNLEKTFDWVADMRGVPQDSIHHAEGNVAIHTNMVLNELMASSEFLLLDEQHKELMWAAALLHDVEKRSTTVKEENGRITSRGHAKRGEFTARQVLYREVPTPFAIREHIAALVKYHGLPLWIMEKPNPTKALLEASLRVDMQLLSLLAKADALGRMCADQKDLLDRIELFKAFCEEQQCWNGPRVFPSELARFVYFQKEDSFPDYTPYDDLKGEVIMLSGLPGMGKDTFLKKNYPDLPVVSLDDIRRKHKLKPDDPSATGWAVQEAKEQAKVFLRKGQPFAWNATNVTRQMRTQWIDLFTSYKARVKLVYIETSYKEWMRQNNNREYPVPHNVLLRLLSKLEVPSLQEAHKVEYIV
jgi:putative nucleotidyltransferase with HDIG domain